MSGIKYDSGKPRMDLIVPGWLWQVGQVLTHGANKHGANNWQEVEPHRYVAANQRHWVQYASGQLFDEETGYHHMALASCNDMFLWYQDCGLTIPTHTCQCRHCQKAV